MLQLLLTQPAWWDRLTAEDHELLHSLPAPHGELVAWLERDVVEHGPRPWAAVRAALEADANLVASLAAVQPAHHQEVESTSNDLRVLLDSLLLARLEADQRELVTRLGSDPDASIAYRELQQRIVQMRRRIQEARHADPEDGTL